MSNMLISLKPKFAELIYSGKKKVELRKNRPIDLEVRDEVFIYESSPAQKITGYFTVRAIEEVSTEEVLLNPNYELGTSESEYWDYVGDRDTIIVIKIKNIVVFRDIDKFSYTNLNSRFGDFCPPQSYLYLRGRYDWEKYFIREVYKLSG